MNMTETRNRAPTTMQTVIVTGKTFDHRETLKSFGARYDGNSRRWTFKSSDPAAIEKFMSMPMPGVIMTVEGSNKPQPVQQPTPVPQITETQLETLREGFANAVGPATFTVGNCTEYLDYFKRKNVVTHFGFDSLGDLVDYVETHGKEHRYSHATYEADWFGTRSMPQAIDFARNGWAYGADKIATLIDRLNVERPLARKRSHGVTGGHVNVGRMLTGHPLHMVRRTKQPKNKVVTLFVESGATAEITSDTMLMRAACVGAIADRMETNGYSCNIVVVSNPIADSFGNARHGLSYSVKVKRASERLNIHALAFALGHTSMHRRFRFACVETRPELRPMAGGQGATTLSFDRHNPTRPGVEFYIPAASKNFTTIEQAMSNLLPEGLPIEFKTEGK